MKKKLFVYTYPNEISFETTCFQHVYLFDMYNLEAVQEGNFLLTVLLIYFTYITIQCLHKITQLPMFRIFNETAVTMSSK